MLVVLPSRRNIITNFLTVSLHSFIVPVSWLWFLVLNSCELFHHRGERCLNIEVFCCLKRGIQPASQLLLLLWRCSVVTLEESWGNSHISVCEYACVRVCVPMLLFHVVVVVCYNVLFSQVITGKISIKVKLHLYVCIVVNWKKFSSACVTFHNMYNITDNIKWSRR